MSFNLQLVLLISGIFTSSMCLLVLLPKWGAKAFFNKVLSEPYNIFLTRSAALPITAIGSLMIWAYFDPSLALPVGYIALE